MPSESPAIEAPSAVDVAGGRALSGAAGFALARAGRQATQIGPLVAAGECHAIALLAVAGPEFG